MAPRFLLSIVIPTYGREQVLVETIDYLERQLDATHELLVIDQTIDHLPETEKLLDALATQPGRQVIRLPEPSVTAAMNAGLLASRAETVLFLDDDIKPGEFLLDAHLAAHESSPAETVLVAGKVIQPWQVDGGTEGDAPFTWDHQRSLAEFMGGNFSVNRDLAIRIGGFDENFRYAAYRYEKDFADRVRAAGFDIRYDPDAIIYHLKAEQGGVRVFGDHLTTIGPGHALGAYYYLLKSGDNVIAGVLCRLWRSIATRFHLTHPWFVPVTIVAETRGFIQAFKLWRSGPVLLSSETVRS